MSKKLKVLQVIDSLAVGGAEMMAINIANGLYNCDVDSHLCVTRTEGLLKEKISSDIGYIFLNKKGSIDFKAILNLKKYIKKHKIEVVHAHSSSFFLVFLVKLIQFNIKIVWHDHYGKAEEVEKRPSFMLKLASFTFSSILSVNKILENWSKKELYCKKTTFLANFASLNNSIKPSTELKGSVGKRIVCVAAFRPQKDHLNLLKAFKLFNNQYPDWTLHLIGKRQNDDYSHQISTYIQKEVLEDKVFFYGSCLDVNHVLEQSDIGVLSSNSEGLPVSLLEYGLAGLPVVVTDVGECKHVVDRNALIVAKEDSNALFEAFEIYVSNEKLRKMNADNFQKHIFENYSENAFFSKLLNIYHSC